MEKFTKGNIDNAIQEIGKSLKDFPISRSALEKFTDSKESRGSLSSIDSDGYKKFIPAMIEKLGIKNILELGNKEGVSTLCIWDHLPKDGKFISIDLIKDLRFCPEKMFHDERVRFLFGNDLDLSIYKDSFPDGVEFLFMDAMHSDQDVSDEFEIHQHFLSDRALVAIDDINLFDERKFFDRITYEKWDLTDLCHASGWGLFLYERKSGLSHQERIFEAYKASAKIWQRRSETSEKIIEKIENRKIKNIVKTTIKKIKPLYRAFLFIKIKFFLRTPKKTNENNSTHTR